MPVYTIKEISRKCDIRKFISFPDRLYKDCRQYVPALHGDQMKSLTDCAPLRYCTRKLWLAYDEKGRIVGRICGMINPRYNERYGKKRARFGWFDTIEDIEVARLLLSTAEAWAKSEGMDEIHGPLYYNTSGKQGMLIEGYENVPVFNCYYNFPYYNDFMEQLGYAKECDWVENKMVSDEGVPDKMVRISKMLKERYNLHEGDLEKLKKDPEQVRRFFQAYNEAFSEAVYNFIPFTDEEIEEEAKAFLPFMTNRLSAIVLDENEDLVGFGIAIPDISPALQKAKGHLFPFGWWHLWRALHKKRCYTCDLMINGAVPKWQNKGVSAIYHYAMSEKYKACGCHWALANPQIETNSAVNVWAGYEHYLHMRRRCYIKSI